MFTSVGRRDEDILRVEEPSGALHEFICFEQLPALSRIVDNDECHAVLSGDRWWLQTSKELNRKSNCLQANGQENKNENFYLWADSCFGKGFSGKKGRKVFKLQIQGENEPVKLRPHYFREIFQQLCSIFVQMPWRALRHLLLFFSEASFCRDELRKH